MKISRRKANIANDGKLSVDIFQGWLDKHGDPAITKFAEKSLDISVKIADLLESKGCTSSQMARELKKERSEVCKWLSGNHNFTIKTLSVLETYFGEDIIHIQPKINNVYFKLYMQAPSVFSPSTEESIEFEPSEYTDTYEVSA